MEKEIWKDVKGYGEYYEVNQYGVVKSKDRLVEIPDYQNAHAYCSGFSYVKPGRVMKQQLNIFGYPVVNLTKNKKQKGHFVHRLVADAFVPNNDNLPFKITKMKIKQIIMRLIWNGALQNIIPIMVHVWKDEKLHRELQIKT